MVSRRIIALLFIGIARLQSRGRRRLRVVWVIFIMKALVFLGIIALLFIGFARRQNKVMLWLRLI